MRMPLFVLGILVFLPFAALAQPAGPTPGSWNGNYCDPALARGARLVCADVAALDQTLVYNRFGSFNPFGMMFALTRDLDGIGSPDQFAAAGQDPRCEDQTGTESPQLQLGRGQAGQVRLRDCKRPRPLVLRANVGDLLLVQVTNLLMDAPPDFSRGMCHQRRDGNPPRTADIGRESVRPHLSAGTQRRELHGEVACDDRSNPASPGGGGDPDAPDWPRTRGVNFVVEGLEPLDVAIGPAA